MSSATKNICGPPVLSYVYVHKSAIERKIYILNMTLVFFWEVCKWNQRLMQSIIVKKFSYFNLRFKYKKNHFLVLKFWNLKRWILFNIKIKAISAIVTSQLCAASRIFTSHIPITIPVLNSSFPITIKLVVVIKPF